MISFTGESTNSLFMLHLFVGPNGIVYLADLERGVARSLDGGSTWILRNDGLPTGDSLGMTIVGVSSLKMDPADPSTLYARIWNPAGFHRSRDGGNSWFPIESPGERFTRILFHPQDPLRILAPTAAGVYQYPAPAWLYAPGDPDDLGP